MSTDTSTPSARELHETLWKAHRIGNLARRRFLRSFGAMARSRLHIALGFSSIAGYSEHYFGLSRSRTFEYLRVEAALASLPLLEAAFSQARLSWSALREITRVASAESEEEWLRFADEHTFAELRAEVKDALEKKRARPRRGSYGLPNMTVELRFELAPDEHELVSKALGKLASELGSSLGGEDPVDRKAALLFLAERVLGSDVEGALGERVERKGSPYTILFHQCPDCRRSALSTRDGLVEIDSGVVARVEGEAEAVAISPEEVEELRAEGSESDRALVPSRERDRPNTPRLTRKVFLRDGRACSNPCCGRTMGLHAHHIEFRAHGGRTALANETLVCAGCHALIHQGRLRLEGNPLDGVRFVPCGPKGKSRALEEFEHALEELASTRDITIAVVESTRRSDSPAMESPIGDSRSFEGRDLEGLRDALETLGYTRAEAKRRITRATETLGAAVSDETLLAEALRRGP